MGEEWEKLRNKITRLQGDLSPFKVDFLDRNSFKGFCDNLRSEVDGFREIWITGYFSETIREALERIAKSPDHNLRLICPEFPVKSKRDKRNLEVLQKLAYAGAEIKVYIRLHARFLVAHNPAIRRGFLLIGSFDFNTECIGKERYDAGIKTRHPDLVKSATELFEQIWKEQESISLEDFMKKGRN